VVRLVPAKAGSLVYPSPKRVEGLDELRIAEAAAEDVGCAGTLILVIGRIEVS
jgi:hypothetical protein